MRAQATTIIFFVFIMGCDQSHHSDSSNKLPITSLRSNKPTNGPLTPTPIAIFHSSIASPMETTSSSDSHNMSGSLLIAWQLREKHALVVGGGHVAASRIQHVLAAGANVTVVSPVDGLNEDTKSLIDNDNNNIVFHNRAFLSTDLDNMDMVLTAIDDVELSRHIGSSCRDRRVPVNVADDPSYCDFYFGSQIRQGPLQIMVSTNGKSPKLANIIRKRIEESIPKGAGEAIEKVGVLREKLKERAPGVGGDVSKRRMKWMVDLCTSWELDDLAGLDDGQIERLLDEGWEMNVVPSRESVSDGDESHAK
jgi:precorrin-2 dehydrogenase / sirohydrochlorin ferrochelatase